MSPSRMMDVSRETQARLEIFSAMVRAENERQNLVAPSTLDHLWHRHVLDSLQLLEHARPGPWLDIGSGAGFPGMVIAIVEPERPIVLVEPRRLRAEFLRHVADTLQLTAVHVATAKVEALPPQDAAIISARAVANLDQLLTLAYPHAAPGCRWLLMKGRKAAEELAAARRTWQGRFSLIPSITDPEASIVMAEDVARRRGR